MPRLALPLCLILVWLTGCTSETVAPSGDGVVHAQQSSPKGTLERVRERGRLVAGVTSSAPPFGFVDQVTKDLVGFEVDICRFIADTLGVDLELRPVTPDTRIPAIAQGTVDLVAARLAHRFSLEEEIDFSIAYFMDGARLLVRASKPVDTVGNLAGRKIAVVKGSPAEESVLVRLPKAEILAFEDYAQALEALEKGRVDALCSDATILLGLRNSAAAPDELLVAGELMTRQPLAIGIAENDSRFRDTVNLALARMASSGEYDRVYSKWFGPQTRHHLSRDWEIEVWPM
jgi:polar amino acid transport system substrate-binding protein